MSENLPAQVNHNESTESIKKVLEKEITPVTPIEVLNPIDHRLEELSGKLMEELDECFSNEDFMEILKRYVEVVGYDAVETIFITEKVPDPYLKYLGYLKDNNTFRNTVEAIAGPSYESLRLIDDVVAKYSEETYREVVEISDIDEAIRNPARKALKDDIAAVYQIAKAMRWETNMLNDPDKKLYPEFWEVFDRLEKLHCAVGILNKATGIRRDLRISDR